MIMTTICMHLFAILIIFVNAFLDDEIIYSYLKERRIKQAHIVGCFKGKVDKVEFVRKFIQGKWLIKLSDIYNIDFQELNAATNYLAVIADGDCPNITYFFKKCGSLKYFDVRHHWLILTNQSEYILNSTILNINSDINMINYLNESYIIKEVYNPASEHGGSLKSSIIGYYSKENGYIARQRIAKYYRRKNMTGVHFKTDVVLPVEFEGTLSEYLASDEKREINTFNRFHNRLMSFCRDYYNYSVEIGLQKSWGYLISNSSKNSASFDGLVGDLERKNVDFGHSPLFVREDRARVMEYGRRTWILRAAFIFRNPKARTSIEIFLEPLSGSIWASTVSVAILVIISMRFCANYEHHQFSPNSDTNSWSSIAIYTIGAFCQQGIYISPLLLGGRIVTIFLLFLSVIIYQFYSASIVSHLLQKPDTTVKTVQQILEANMKAGCEDILYNRDYFLYTTDRASKELYHKRILNSENKNNSHFLKVTDGLALVRHGGYAFHVELATAYPIIRETFDDKSICELREVQMYRTQPMHANLQKHSPFRDMVDTCLQRLAENGQLNREINFWHPSKPQCISSSKNRVFSVPLEDFYPALITIFFGIGLSLIILGFELFIHSREQKAQEKQKSNHKNGNSLYPFTL